MALANPLAYVHNKEYIYVEGNNPNVQNKSSCFKVFNLKGPIDINYLLKSVFSPSERTYYDLQVSEYNGKTAKVKFNFTDRSHMDLIRKLQDSAGKFFNVSKNGLVDWLASDTSTFRAVYRDTDREAARQIRTNNILSNDDASSSTELKLGAIMDEKLIERELNDLSKKISSKTNLKNYELERLFHNTFQRKDMTITINDLSSEFFGQIRNVVAFTDNEDKDSDSPLHQFSRFLYKQIESRVNLTLGVIKNYKFGIMLTLWNLYNALYSIHVSYQVLSEADNEYKKILQSNKSDFVNYLSNMDQILNDLLVILCDVVDSDKYERIKHRLGLFVKAAEGLLKLVMEVGRQLNELVEKLENQKKSLLTKVYVSAATIGISALVIGGYMYNAYNSDKKNKNYEGKLAVGGAALVLGTSTLAVSAYSAKTDIENSIEKQRTMIDQLQSTYQDLKDWKKVGKKHIEREIDDMNENRSALNEELAMIKKQCKSIRDTFNSL